jgi:hypothetical protein
MTFCTLKGKDALLEELKGMEEDKKLDFVTRKRAEIEAITAVSSDLIIPHMFGSLLTQILTNSMLRNAKNGRQIFRRHAWTN